MNMTDAPPRLSVEKISNKIFDELVNPKLPGETQYELRKRYWSLAGEPATHLEFTHVPDQATLDAIKWEMETIYQAGSMPGFELVSDVLQLSMVNRLMLLKSPTYTEEPNLMHMMMGAMPNLKANERERPPDTNPPNYAIGDKLISLIPRRGY